MKINIRKYIITYFIVIFLMFICLVLAFSIPNKYIEQHQNDAIKVLSSEGQYPEPFFSSGFSQLDNFTDKLIIDGLTKSSEESIVIAAMYKNYPRYWHGYATIVRPLLSIFSYQQIRYLSMIVFFFLFSLSISLIAKKTKTSIAVYFAISIALSCITIIPISLQFVSIFIIMFCSMDILLLHKKTISENILLYFFIIGMITNYFDFLTAPLVTLCFPLIAYLLLQEVSLSNANKKDFIITTKCALTWGFGYGLTWIGKWSIGTIILKENVFLNATEKAKFRLMGNNDYPLNRMNAILSNIKTMYCPMGKRVLFFLLLILIIVFFILIFLYKTNTRILRFSILFVGLFPYIWYFVLGNHSIIHHWFTYRSQTATTFAFLVFLEGVLSKNNKRSIKS